MSSAAGTPPRRPGRRFGSAGDIIRSLLVVLGFALVIVWLTPRPQADPVTAIDYAGALAQTRQAVPFPVLAPEPLPPGWRATSARTGRTASGSSFSHLGLVTAHDRYAGLEQSDERPEVFLARIGAGEREEGVAWIGGSTWAKRSGASPQIRTLWRATGGSLVAVTGDASWNELEQLATRAQADADQSVASIPPSTK